MNKINGLWEIISPFFISIKPFSNPISNPGDKNQGKKKYIILNKKPGLQDVETGFSVLGTLFSIFINLISQPSILLFRFHIPDIQKPDNKKQGHCWPCFFEISVLLIWRSWFSSSIVPASPFLVRPTFRNMPAI